MILFDTSAVIALLRGQLPPEKVLSETIGISTIVELELHRGVFNGGGKQEQLRVQSFLKDVEIFEFDRDAALETAKLMTYLRTQGTPIGDLDSQIAGHSISLALPLITQNIKHFEGIPEINLIEWT